MANPESTEFQPTHPAVTEQSRSQPDILARLEAAISEIQDSESFRRYLDVQARFHRYSWGNTLLILLQRPDATQVAGFHAWKKLSRAVKKGEKGIAIVVPHVRRKKDENDEDRITGFGTGYVFDVQQTDGEPLPTVEVPVLDGEEGQQLYERLTDLVAAEGLSLARLPGEAMPTGVMGFYTPSERSIVVAEAAPPQMAKTLAHELGHHFSGRHDTREESETIAEATAYVVCARHGLDTGARSFPYVATWSQDPAVFKQALSTVQRVSAQIIDGLAKLPPPAVPAARLEVPSAPPATEVPYQAPTPPPTSSPLQPRLF